MALNTLKDVYIDQLQDLYSANRQSIEATRKLADKATDAELKSALKDGVDGIERGIETLKPIIEGHDAKPTGEFCKGMEGIVKEVDAHVLNTDFGDDAVRDAEDRTDEVKDTLKEIDSLDKELANEDLDEEEPKDGGDAGERELRRQIGVVDLPRSDCDPFRRLEDKRLQVWGEDTDGAVHHLGGRRQSGSSLGC